MLKNTLFSVVNRLAKVPNAISFAITFPVLCMTLLCTPGIFAQTLSFSDPPTEYSTILIGGQASGLGGVGTAAWNNGLYVAYTSNNGNGDLYLTHTTDGTTFSSSQLVNLTTNSVSNPALAVYNGDLYIAWIDTNGNPQLAYTADGLNFYGGGTVLDGALFSPSLVAYKGNLYLAYVRSSDHALMVCSTTTSCTNESPILLGDSPSLTVFNSTLYVAYHNNGGDHYVWVATSIDGVHFTPNSSPNSSHTSTAPSIVVHNNILYIIFRQNSTGDRIYYTYSTNGTTFVSPIQVSITMGGPPSAVVPTFACCSTLSGDLFVVFRQNNSYHYMFTTHAP